jgi:hypothetical protein
MKTIIKKLLFITAALITINISVYAQPTYTVSPPSFTAEDEITITVDVSNTSLKDYAGDVWMWAWISEGCPSGCDAPTNVDPAGSEKTDDATMTRVSANVYSITIVPSAFYKKPPSQIKRIGFKLKSVSWSDGKQTDSDVLINVDPLIFTAKVNRVFPTKVTKDDVVTLYLDQNAATDPNLKYALDDFSVTVKAYDGNTEVGSVVDVNTVNAGDGIHYLRVLPTFTLNADNITSIRYRFKSKANQALQSSEFELVFFE